MATEYIDVSGKAKWARLVEPDSLYNKWQVVLYPDTKSLEVIRKLQTEGIKNKLRKDDEGYNMNFGRPTFIENRKSGLRKTLEPPTVKGKDDKPIDGITVGNGSDVTLGLEVYSHQVPGNRAGAKAARLKSVRVDNLVPYERPKPPVEDAKETLF